MKYEITLKLSHYKRLYEMAKAKGVSIPDIINNSLTTYSFLQKQLEEKVGEKIAILDDKNIIKKLVQIP